MLSVSYDIPFYLSSQCVIKYVYLITHSHTDITNRTLEKLLEMSPFIALYERQCYSTYLWQMFWLLKII